jgi:DeoR family fructose operon transcriptional repressor
MNAEHAIDLYAEERRLRIADTVRRRGRVEVASLARDFGVTPETIRRDLTELERLNVLRRVYGGAISVDRFRPEPALAEKATAMAEEKDRIARAALRFVPERGTVLLDAGTSTGALAAVLPERELTVVTNALPVAMTLADRSDLQVWVLGGRVRGRTLAHVDDWALRQLAELRVDVGFLGTNGISVERGLSTPDPAEAAVKRAMRVAAKQVVVLADHTKVGEEHAVRFASIDEIDVLVTDDGISTGDRAALEDAGVEVVVA